MEILRSYSYLINVQSQFLSQSVIQVIFHSLTHSLTDSLTHSLTPSLTYFTQKLQDLDKAEVDIKPYIFPWHFCSQNKLYGVFLRIFS